MELTPSFRVLLLHFRPVFTAPSFRLFVLILTGWALSSRHRYSTECLFTAGQVGIGHWSCYHCFFSHYAWSLDSLCQALAQLLIERFAPAGPILLAGDATLCRKRGLGLFGAGMHHDPLQSSKAVQVFSWGHSWVVLGLLVRCPRWAPTKVFVLPLLFRLYANRQGVAKGKKKQRSQPAKQQRAGAATPAKKKQWRPTNPKQRTRPQLLVELLTLLAGWLPQRQFVVCVDTGYAGKSVLRHLPCNVDLISQVHPQGVLYAPPPPPTGKRGARRKKGARLPDLQTWANDPASPWQTLGFDPYGLHATLQVKVQQALYYTAGKDRLLTIILTRDTTGKRPEHRCYCTRLDWSVREVLSAYASRWALEVTFEGAKQVLGLEGPGQSTAQGGAADGPAGVGAVQPDRAVVRYGGPHGPAFSRTAVVSAEAGTIVPRHGNHATPQKLGRKIRGGGAAGRPPREMAGDRGGVGGPGGLNGTPPSRLYRINAPQQPAALSGNAAADRWPTLGMCETRTKESRVLV